MLLAQWLTIKTADSVSVEHLFRDFKAWLKDTGPSAEDVMADIADHARVWLSLSALPESTPAARAWYRMLATKTATAVPLLLNLYQRTGIDDRQRARVMAAVDSFLVRRSVCSLPKNDYNNLFVAVLRKALSSDDAHVADAAIAELVTSSARSRYWPNDHEFVTGLMRGGLYRRLEGPRIRTLLEGLEDHLRSGSAEQLVPLATRGHKPLTVEHVMPQRWETHWPLPEDVADPDKAARERVEAADSLGNLTLLTGSLNSSVQHGPWSSKKAALAVHSVTLLTNAPVLRCPAGLEGKAGTTPDWSADWDERRIQLRSFWLARTALLTWPAPPTPDQ